MTPLAARLRRVLTRGSRAPGRTEASDGTTERLLREAERTAQERAGLARVAIGVILLVTVEWAGSNIPFNDPVILQQVDAARIILLLFALLGGVVYSLARRGIGTSQLPFVTATTDAVLILGNAAYNHATTGVAGIYIFSFPVVWVVPIALAANAVYYRPRLQIYAASLYVVGLFGIATIAGAPPLLERPAALARLYLQFGPPPNGVRLMMIVATGLVLVLVARQGRALLERAVRETTLRLNLTRYLPRELAPVLTEASLAELRGGRRVRVALLFVDIRGSTALAESLDPLRLAGFITRFRERVMAAAGRHGGVVDKFIGDGALLVFGVPLARADDPARALACARDLVGAVANWSAAEGFDPPVRIGVGVHCGEVFAGVVGAEERLEFTVLGEPVSVAARLEQATKTFGGPILASQEVDDAAGEGGAWEAVSREPLRGVARTVTILKPREATALPLPARGRG